MDKHRLLTVGLIVAFLAVLAPAAHVLELPNKLHLDGPLWLAVQQRLYHGWGPLIGAPLEVAGLAINLLLAATAAGNRMIRRCCGSAAALFAAMIAVFFLFNQPVNLAVNGWTTDTLPPDWPAWRWRWEVGHAITAALSVTAAFRVGQAWLGVRVRQAALG